MGFFKGPGSKKPEYDFRESVIELTDVMAAFKSTAILKDEYERISGSILSRQVGCPKCSKGVTLGSMIKRGNRELDFDFICPKCNSPVATSIRYGDMPE
jgi:hypothetical protein